MEYLTFNRVRGRRSYLQGTCSLPENTSKFIYVYYATGCPRRCYKLSIDPYE
ncbi:hypothetical protein ASPZODRAFT_136627 [Penicilliopsis zonata CBS 506.65]|uniref:Uncharacterized protein n=1 Tax=Penicilliopsis zonata CBS 506.65 TaxID=1073090 RepID=A0A1L9S7F0_9EURO|nr:hypothetical protein ASPZODRAFT_136627 [Penicilliopsis zonata CBS 506.65]OJJ43082.1 hypothetical protein ASPZODRAFT_136627 [Penicilliopsis zonata CBS 506.65]